jgi:hypothetical protein
VREQDDRYTVALRSDDGATHVSVDARVTDALPASSVFGSVQAASDFFEAGSLGYSATPHQGQYDGLELLSLTWQITPLEVQAVQSSFFEDTGHFPAGAVAFDCALLMRGIVHEWHARAPLGVAAGDVALAARAAARSAACGDEHVAKTHQLPPMLTSSRSSSSSRRQCARCF